MPKNNYKAKYIYHTDKFKNIENTSLYPIRKLADYSKIANNSYHLCYSNQFMQGNKLVKVSIKKIEYYKINTQTYAVVYNTRYYDLYKEERESIALLQLTQNHKQITPKAIFIQVILQNQSNALDAILCIY